MLKSSIRHIVLLNGWSASSAMWDAFFESGFDSFSVDILNFSSQTSVLECNQLIESHVKPGTLLLGWSLGGQLALNYLSNYESIKVREGMVEAAVFLHATPCFINQGAWQHGVSSDEFASLQFLLTDADMTQLVRRFAFLLLSGSAHRKVDRVLLNDIYRPELLPSHESLHFGLELLRTFDLRASVDKLQLPTCWLFGSEDALLKRSLITYMEGLLSLKQEGGVKSEAMLIDKMGHFPCGQHAGEVKEKLFSFLENL